MGATNAYHPHLHPEFVTQSFFKPQQAAIFTERPHRKFRTTGEEDRSMPPLPPQQLLTSITTLQLKECCRQEI
jgi:hypothetical protein